MELTARVVQLLPLATGVSSAGNQWQRATIIVEWQSGQFTKKLALSNMKKAEEFINLLIGQEYAFKFDVTSREYQGKWYHDVNCYAWELAQQAPAAQPQADPAAPAAPQQAPQAYGCPPQGYAPQPAYPPQMGGPAPQPYAPQPAPMYNPAQPQYAAPAPPPAMQDAPF